MAELRIPAERLLEFSKETLARAEADEPTAEATSYAMLHASLHGVDSHGIRLLPFYVKSLRTGLAKANPRITVKPQRRAAVLVDADGGLGHLPTYRATDEACEIARDCGIGMAGVINSTHFGAAGAYALAAANAGFIALVTCNSGALVVPHGGARAFHGTSPIAIAAPRARRRSVPPRHGDLEHPVEQGAALPHRGPDIAGRRGDRCQWRLHARSRMQPARWRRSAGSTSATRALHSPASPMSWAVR